MSATIRTDGEPLSLSFVAESGMLYLGMPLGDGGITPVAEVSLSDLLAALAEVTA